MLRCYVLEGTVENFNKISGVGPTTLGVVGLSHIPVVKLSEYFISGTGTVGWQGKQEG